MSQIAATNSPQTNTRRRPRVPASLRTNLLPIAILIVLVVGTAIISPEFFQTDNLLNVARQASIVGVVAVGMTFVILTGGIDLSVGSILAVCAVTMAIMAESGYPTAVIIVAVIALGAAGGVLNGLGVALLGVQPFIMTLATLAIGRGLALRISDGAPKEFLLPNGTVDFLGSGGLGRIPGPLFIFLGLALIGFFVLRYLPFGRYIYAIGGSLEAARLSGVRTKRNVIGAYAISGACAGVAGIMTASRLSVGDPTAGNLAELDAIAAVVIGGTSLIGGVGGMPGTVAGALLLAVVANLLTLAGVSPFDQQIVKGVVILIAVLLAGQALRSRTRGAAAATALDDEPKPSVGQTAADPKAASSRPES